MSEEISSTYEIPVLGETPKAVAPVVPAAKAAPAEGGKNAAQDTGDQATPAKPEGDKPDAVAEPTPEQVAKRNQNRLDRKIDKAYRKAAEQTARADFLEKQLNEERQKVAPKQDDGAPKLEQFDYDPEKYAQAVADHRLTQAGKEAEAKQKAEAQKQYQEKLTTAWEEKVERGTEKYDDWQEKVGDLKPVVPFIAALMEAENGDDIAYYLGSNPKEAERIVRLPPISQAREIGKLEAKLLSEPAKPKVPSNAPAPLKPVGGSGSPSTRKLTEIDDQNEFEKRRRATIAQRR